MSEGKLTKWVKVGYPHLKEGAGLAPWVLPERGLSRTADEVGDPGLLEISRPLGLADGVEKFLEVAPDPIDLTPQVWQDAVNKWPPLSQVGAVITAFLETSGAISEQCQALKSKIEPMVICRNLIILLFAPFIDKGRALLEEIAGVLGGQADAPAELIRSYARAVSQSDIEMLERVNQCAVKYSEWQQWASALQEQALGCRSTPKLVAVTPSPSADLIGVLATLVKEGNNGPSGDNK